MQCFELDFQANNNAVYVDFTKTVGGDTTFQKFGGFVQHLIIDYSIASFK